MKKKLMFFLVLCFCSVVKNAESATVKVRNTTDNWVDATVIPGKLEVALCNSFTLRIPPRNPELGVSEKQDFTNCAIDKVMAHVYQGHYAAPDAKSKAMVIETPPKDGIGGGGKCDVSS